MRNVSVSERVLEFLILPVANGILPGYPRMMDLKTFINDDVNSREFRLHNFLHQWHVALCY